MRGGKGAGLTYSVNQIQVQAGAPALVMPACCRRRHDTAKEKVTTVEIVGFRAEAERARVHVGT